MTLAGNILIVEDDIVFCKILINFFSKNGYHAEDVQTAKDALSRISQTNINIVIVDYKLPDLNGVELLKEIETIAPNCNKILMSRYSSEEILKEVQYLHGFKFLKKPFHPHELLEMVNELSAR